MLPKDIEDRTGEDLYTEAMEGVRDSYLGWGRVLKIIDLMGYEKWREYVESRVHLDNEEDPKEWVDEQEIKDYLYFCWLAERASVLATDG